MTGKSIKIPKSSFKRRLYHTPNDTSEVFLGHYLAGLIEGDGSIIVPKTIRNQNGKLLYPVVKITFVKKDAPLADKIQRVLNGGTKVYPLKTFKVFSDLLFQDLNIYIDLPVVSPH